MSGKFARVQANMVQCATNWSIPPKVCTNCWEQYIAFKQIEYETKHLDKVFSLDNRTCTQVIYDNYLLSYSYDISEALTSSIWAKSRCDSCLTISWNLTANDSRVDFSNRTVQFQERLFQWRDCVANFTAADGDFDDKNPICSYCKAPFNKLFSFYWDIYVEPGVEFCVDVETTILVWHRKDSAVDYYHPQLLITISLCIPLAVLLEKKKKSSNDNVVMF
ncbi:hypothetical protein ANCCAN_23419 [Ancylostoma caninum]|uniref:Uncharacterized protein n=1 Tax=Ancylostoma caninum TaxID=29170 RepID=A0A368FJ27_ANCCA|nr:hypothetical protein ANCCAN_23419 [Ancylostoma caninum]